MRSLVTGGYGFVGRHLSKHLVSCGDDVAVTYHPDERGSHNDAFRFPLPQSVQTFGLDIANKQAVKQLLAVVQPDAIYHLAAVSFVPAGEGDIEEIFRINTFGTINLLEAIHEAKLKTRVLTVSSAEVYGEPWPGSLPYTESSVLRPISNYGLSKAAADLATFKFSQREMVDSVRVRPFPHIGPGQSDQFAISSFAKQLAEIKLGKRAPTLQVGNLDPKRDYSDVSDIVRGYRDALLNGKRGEAYNLCSGRSLSIGEVLQLLMKVSEVEAEIVVDPERVRAVDITNIYGSYEKAQRDFGWHPIIDLEGTLTSIFAFWVEALAR